MGVHVDEAWREMMALCVDAPSRATLYRTRGPDFGNEAVGDQDVGDEGFRIFIAGDDRGRQEEYVGRHDGM